MTEPAGFYGSLLYSLIIIMGISLVSFANSFKGKYILIRFYSISKVFDVIISIHDVYQQNVIKWLSYAVDLVMKSKFCTYNISLKENIMSSIL